MALLKFSETPNRADVNPAPALKSCRLVATAGTGTLGRNVNVPVSELITPDDVLQTFDATSSLPVSGKALAEVVSGSTVDGIAIVPDSYFNDWTSKRTGKVYQAFVPYDGTAHAYTTEAARKPQYLYDTTGAVTTEENANYGMVSPTIASILNASSAAGDAGNDPYLGIHLFTWYRGNAIRRGDGIPFLTALEGTSTYATSGAAEVYTYGPTFWWRVTTVAYTADSGTQGQMWEITDSPRDGFYPWVESIRGYATNDDGTLNYDAPIVAPYWCHASYMGGDASDGFIRSQPGLVPHNNMSYTQVFSLMTGSTKKGAGYFGGDMATQLFGMLFGVIKYGTKNIKTYNLGGNTNYNYSGYAVTVASTNAKTVTISSSNAANFNVGDVVSIGTGSARDYGGNIRSVVACARITAKTASDTNVILTLDTPSTFSTTTSNYVSSDFNKSGDTDALDTYGKVDGTYKLPAATSAFRNSFRIMGTEYAPGAYFVGTDCVAYYNSNTSANYYWAPRGVARINGSTEDAYVAAGYEKIAVTESGQNTYVKNIHVEPKFGIFWEETAASSDSQGWGCYHYVSSTGFREVLFGGALTNGSHAGLPFVGVADALSLAPWFIGSRG